MHEVADREALRSQKNMKQSPNRFNMVSSVNESKFVRGFGDGGAGDSFGGHLEMHQYTTADTCKVRPRLQWTMSSHPPLPTRHTT